ITGMMNDKERGFFDKQRQKRADRYDRKIGRRIQSKRADLSQRLNNAASADVNRNGLGRSRAFVRRKSLSTLGGWVGGVNAASADAATRERIFKEMDQQTSNGDDTEVRALIVNRKDESAKIRDSNGALI